MKMCKTNKYLFKSERQIQQLIRSICNISKRLFINPENIFMKGEIIVVLIAVIIGAAYLTLDIKSANLKQEVRVATYDKQLSKRYSAYAKIAYCPQSLVREWSCKDCKTYSHIQDLHTISNPHRDIFGFAFYDTDLNKIILVWRGTIDFKNQVNDFTYAKIPYTCQHCEVHLGFYQGYRAVAKQTYEVIQSLFKKYPNAKVITTGHSFGAALSTISAVQINKKSPNLVNQIHNFGCPRVGNAKLAQHIKGEFQTLFRVVHAHDVFTHLPEQQQNYAHYPFEVLYDENMTNYQICDESGEDPTCSNSYSPNYNVPDHRFYFFPMNSTGC